MNPQPTKADLRSKLAQHKTVLDKHFKSRHPRDISPYPLEVYDELGKMRDTGKQLVDLQAQGVDVSAELNELQDHFKRFPALKSHPVGCNKPGTT